MKTIKSYSHKGFELALVFKSMDKFTIVLNNKEVVSDTSYVEASDKFDEAVKQINSDSTEVVYAAV